jgi:hypothetical protein
MGARPPADLQGNAFLDLHCPSCPTVHLQDGARRLEPRVHGSVLRANGVERRWTRPQQYPCEPPPAVSAARARRRGARGTAVGLGRTQVLLGVAAAKPVAGGQLWAGRGAVGLACAALVDRRHRRRHHHRHHRYLAAVARSTRAGGGRRRLPGRRCRGSSPWRGVRRLPWSRDTGQLRTLSSATAVSRTRLRRLAHILMMCVTVR